MKRLTQGTDWPEPLVGHRKDSALWPSLFCCSRKSVLPFFPDPLFPLHKAGDQHAGDSIPGTVHHSGHRIHHRTQNCQDRKSFRGKSIQGDNEEFPGESPAGNPRHHHSGKNGNQDRRQEVLHIMERHLEQTEQKRDLQNGTQTGAIHMDGGSHRDHHLPDVRGNPDFP